MNEEWPDYIYDACEVATAERRPDPAARWNELCLRSALEHLARRREQVYSLRRRVKIFFALALVEGGILLGLLLRHLGG